MNEMNVQDMVESFGFIFLLSRRFEYVTDQVLSKDGLTTKQLLALIAIERGFETLPSISQVAEILSTTHQNMKKIALQLEKKEFIEIIRDDKDKRRLLLKTTKKNQEYWDSRSSEHLQAIQGLFSSLLADEVHSFNLLLKKLLEGIEATYRNARG
ncbi:MAG: MarR family transcriptional regulator [Candidatus Thorarchaeota archaeon]